MASKSLCFLDAREPNQKEPRRFCDSETPQRDNRIQQACLCSGQGWWFRTGRKAGLGMGQVTYSGGFLLCHQERWAGSSSEQEPYPHCCVTGWGVSPKCWGSPRLKVWGGANIPAPTHGFQDTEPQQQSPKGEPSTFASCWKDTIYSSRWLNCLFKKTALGPFLEHPSSLGWLHGDQEEHS